VQMDEVGVETVEFVGEDGAFVHISH
jgi:hypothetical protein